MPNNLGIAERTLDEVCNAANDINSPRNPPRRWDRQGIVRITDHVDDTQGEEDDPMKMAIFVSKAKGAPWEKTDNVLARVVFQAGETPPEPVITQQPRNQTGEVGDRVVMTVEGQNYDSLQWSKGGSDLNGETGTTLAFDPAELGDAGNYAVRLIASGYPDLVSDTVTVTITEPEEPEPEEPEEGTESTYARKDVSVQVSPLFGCPTNVTVLFPNWDYSEFN